MLKVRFLLFGLLQVETSVRKLGTGDTEYVEVYLAHEGCEYRFQTAGIDNERLAIRCPYPASAWSSTLMARLRAKGFCIAGARSEYIDNTSRNHRTYFIIMSIKSTPSAPWKSFLISGSCNAEQNASNRFFLLSAVGVSLAVVLAGVLSARCHNLYALAWWN